MRKYIESIKPFTITSIFFAITVFAIKLIELTYALKSGTAIESFSGIIYGNLIASLFISSCVFILYNIISAFSKKAALILSSITFSILAIAEACLIIYYKTTGLLMGAELIDRPLWETIQTIKSITDIWTTLAVIAMIAFMTFISLKLSKRKTSNFTSGIILCLMIISIPLTFLLKPSQDKNIVNKTWYCYYHSLIDNDIFYNNKYQIVEFDKEQFDKYKQIFPQREIIDEHYPLERTDNTDNVLGPFFKKTNEKPNIAVIIVESLGTDFFNYGFTPFLDSLSRHSLLWTNCLSTTPRSSGVVPALMASAPHGIKGFQFGDIPEHNSLFAILKENGYDNNVFYSYDFAFDRVYDYLVSQKVDYMSPFLYECSLNKSKNIYDYNFWGYQDMTMYKRSMEIMKERKHDNPQLDLFITMSQHDRLDLNVNEEMEDYYYEKAEAIFATLPENAQNVMKDKVGFIASFLYGDDAIKQFFQEYNNHYDDNTIFIITGDHSLNIYPSNPLNAFHVPLIIWSPLLEKTQHFNSVISHNDFAPTFTALLRENFNIKKPNNIHWISDGLDTTSEFNSKTKTYFMRYSKKVNDFVFDNYYFTSNNDNDKAYLIKDGLCLKEIFGTDTISMLKDRLNTMTYIDRYVYRNNRITKNPLIPNDKYTLIDDIRKDSIVCVSNPEMPSVMKPEKTAIYSSDIKADYSEIKVIMNAKLKYTEDIHQDDFIYLTIKCNNGVSHYDRIARNIIEDNYTPGKWMNLEVSKIFPIDKDNINLDIHMIPPGEDKLWNPNHSVTLKDIEIKILGIKK